MQGIILHTKFHFDIYNIHSQLSFISTNDLLKTKSPTLLIDASLKVTNVKIQDAYEKTYQHTVAVSNSENYSHIFRMLNFTHIRISHSKKSYINIDRGHLQFYIFKNIIYY